MTLPAQIAKAYASQCRLSSVSGPSRRLVRLTVSTSMRPLNCAGLLQAERRVFGVLQAWGTLAQARNRMAHIDDHNSPYRIHTSDPELTFVVLNSLRGSCRPIGASSSR